MVELTTRFECRPITTVLLDCNGVLFDSLPLTARVINAARVRSHLPPLPRSQIRLHLGRGGEHLLHATLLDGLPPGRPCDVDRIRDTFERGFAAAPPVFNGACEFLQAVAPHVVLGVATNMEVDLAHRLLRAAHLEHFFDGRVISANKPSPRRIRALLHTSGTKPEGTLLLGDCSVDFAAGWSSGTRPVGCRWGYDDHVRPKPWIWINSFDELLTRLRY